MRTFLGVAAALVMSAGAADAQEATAETSAETAFYEVLFGFSRETLDAEAIETLSHLSDDYLIRGADTALVAGHADTVGDPEINRALAERRALTVRRNLIARGVPAADIVVTSLGDTALAVDTPDETRERLNRRVVVEVAGFGARPAPDPLTPFSFPLPPPAPVD